LVLGRNPWASADARLFRLIPRICVNLGIIDVAYSTAIICRQVDQILIRLLWLEAVVWSDRALLGRIVDLTRRGDV